tara:strand:+ start:657 stop:1079 length:423 start_codon:yes stop_codon:yes gene_type:complete
MNCKVYYSVFIIITFAFLGCKSITLNTVKKQLVMPGYRLGKPMIDYSTTIISKKKFKIISLKIDRLDKKFDSFLIIELTSGIIKYTNQNLKPGSYYIKLSIPEKLVSKESVDNLTIEVSLKNKVLKLKSESFLSENLLGK